MRRNAGRALTLLLPLALLAACTPVGERVLMTGQPAAALVCPRTGPAPQPGRFNVGPAGGLLRVGDNELQIPVNALPRTVIVTFGENPSDTVGVRLDTEGVQFDRPARLTISAARCTVGIGTEWAIWRMRPNMTPEQLQTQFNAGQRTYSTQFRGHSGFVVASRT